MVAYRCPKAAFHSFDRHRHVSVAIIGGGFTGMTAAMHLAARGIEAAVLEAGEIGSGASGLNAGFVVPNFAKADPAYVLSKLGTIVGGGCSILWDRELIVLFNHW